MKLTGGRLPRSSRFVDLISGQPALHDTRAALLCDDNHLYVGCGAEDPNVAATFTERVSPICENNDVELFIAGQDSYYEFEIDALDSIYEVSFIWDQAYEKGGFANVQEFSRSNPKVRPFNGVGFKAYPRGRRLGSWAWDFPGLQTGVRMNGTLNRSGDEGSGWAWSRHGIWDSHVPEYFTYIQLSTQDVSTVHPNSRL